MNNIYSQFSIKDLENLSGIKAHTIRIWEKRYHILEPSRTESNIRYYTISNLQKLLNVVHLYNSGLKISKIAALNDNELKETVRQTISSNGNIEFYINEFKLSMAQFNRSLFEQTYQKLLTEFSFRYIFLNVFIPLLQHIGLEWQSNAITPAHEHFITSLIKQKLQINIEHIQHALPDKTDAVFVLFLPANEIHELGLLYIHYELTLKGQQSIYLGQSVPIDSLTALLPLYKKIKFISYFTIQPSVEESANYLNDFTSKLLPINSENSLWILGRNTKDINANALPKNIILFNNIESLLNNLD